MSQNNLAQTSDANPNPAFPLSTVRHTCAHLMAAAIQDLWPEAKFGVGPDIENGFYYDIDLPTPLTPEDLTSIQARMKKFQKKKFKMEMRELPTDEAIAFMKEQNQPYKVELLTALKERGSTKVLKDLDDENLIGEGSDTVTFYTLGNFVDLCRGPHVDHSGQTGVFKLHSISGAYWRGDSNNPQLQRIYGLCYETKDELEAEIERLEQVKLRDHRKIGKELGLFTFSEDVGPGLPLWLPKGTTLRDELEYLAREEERKDGYQRVKTPVLTKENLYYRSRHLPYYEDDMYAPMDIDGENYYLRPMNCPHHHMAYNHGQYSYRDLPIRLTEYGDVYRYEASGALSGLMRTRGFCQNDAHIYCRHDQAKDEFLNVMKLHERYYKMFDIEDFYMRLSLPDMEKLDKYVDYPEEWARSVEIIREAMIESGLPYKEVEGEAAFYGPKIDFMIKSVIGTEYAISTNQLDFLATKTFDLTYVGEDGGNDHPVYVIHRAPLGSHERFVAFLLEHYAGKFPTWLAPEQVRIVPIADRHVDYCNEVMEKLLAPRVHNANGGLRVSVDSTSNRMQKKIRTAQVEKVPYILVAGDQEAENGTVAVRLRTGEDLGAFKVDDVIARIVGETETRKDLDS